MLKQQIIAFYLDWCNNFVSVTSLADHYDVPEWHALDLIRIGRQLHEKEVAQ